MAESRNRNTRLDSRSEFVVNVHELGRRPGAMRERRVTAEAPSGLGVEMIEVPVGTSIDLDLRFEAVVEGVLVTGVATVPLQGECARCLEPISGESVASFQELFAYPGTTSAEVLQEDEDEISRLDGDLLDLEPVVRDAVVLALPLAPVCREDCPGLCVICGERIAELPPGHTHEQIDPRWAALRQMPSTDHESQEN